MQLNILTHVKNNTAMIREVKFESQDRRIKQILAALNENGIKDIEEANAICDAACTSARDLHAKVIIAVTKTGKICPFSPCPIFRT